MKRITATTTGLSRTSLSLAIGCALCSGVATAQDVPVGPAGVDEITVTGSRITRDGMNSPTPITAISADDLQMMAPGQIIDSLDYLPPFFMNDAPDTAASKSASAGASNVNLRGLGAQRTLVLLDGRRMVPSNRLGAVDINLFPEAMVERVEIVTGGASAVYGTDAVAGVVNFILKDDFEGFDIHTQVGATERSDGESKEVSVAYGTSIGERGHLMVSGEWFDADKIETLEGRDWFRHWGLIQNPGAGPRDLVRPDVVSYTYTDGGLINSTRGRSRHGRGSRPDGDPPLRVPARRLRAAVRARQSRRRQPGDGPARRTPGGSYGTHQIANGGSGWDAVVDRGGSLVPETERGSLFAHYAFDLSDTTTLYAQVLAGNNEVNSVGTLPLGIAGWAGTIYSGNPFLPANIQQLMTTNNIPSFLLERYHTTADLAHDRFVTDNDTRSLTFGADTELTERLRSKAGRSAATRSSARTTTRSRRSTSSARDRLPEAMDAVRHPTTSEIVCRASLFDPARLRQLRADQSARRRPRVAGRDRLRADGRSVHPRQDGPERRRVLDGRRHRRRLGRGRDLARVRRRLARGVDRPDARSRTTSSRARCRCNDAERGVHEQHRRPAESAGGLHAASAACRRSSRPRRTRSSSSRTCSRSRARTRSRKCSPSRCCRSSRASRASSSSISPSRRATRTTKARAESGRGRPASIGRSTTPCGCARRCRATFARRRCRSGSTAKASAAPSTTRRSAA